MASKNRPLAFKTPYNTTYKLNINRAEAHRGGLNHRLCEERSTAATDMIDEGDRRSYPRGRRQPLRRGGRGLYARYLSIH